ncbi:MAG: hypothetical protein AAF253_02325 [Pseudomonadota bacterium]
MSATPALLPHLKVQGTALHARVLARDDCHLLPESLTRAAAARLRAGIAALEAWLRRVILYLAFQLEPGLQPDQSEYAKVHRPRRLQRPSLDLRILANDIPLPGAITAGAPFAATPHWQPRETAIWATPLLRRLSALKALVDAPEARARRLALHLARRRPGLLVVPGRHGAVQPRRFGTELSTLYHALAQAILTASRARPPPLGPRPRAGPRIRTL